MTRGRTLNIRHIDLNLLVVFNALMSNRSVTRAAEELCLSQSAISQSLRRLRETLEDPLLVRSGNEMLPTERAQAMIQPVSRILRELEQILAPPKLFDPGKSSRSFMIRAPEFFECIIYPRLYEVITEQAPGISVHLNYLEYEINEAELLNQDADLIFGIDQYMPLPKSLSHELLPQDRLTLMVSNDHPLQEPISAKDYASQPHVYDSLVQFVDINSWLKARNLKHKTTLNVESYTAVVGLIERANYVATLPQLAASHLARFGDVRLLPPPRGFPGFQMNMVWHPLYDTDSGLQWLRKMIKRIYAELLKKQK